MAKPNIGPLGQPLKSPGSNPGFFCNPYRSCKRFITSSIKRYNLLKPNHTVRLGTRLTESTREKCIIWLYFPRQSLFRCKFTYPGYIQGWVTQDFDNLKLILYKNFHEITFLMLTIGRLQWYLPDVFLHGSIVLSSFGVITCISSWLFSKIQ